MKPSLIIRALCLCMALALAPELAHAQNCSSFYPMEEGSRLDYTVYGKSGKPDGSYWQQVKGTSNTPEGLKVMLLVGYSDNKGKNSYESEYGFTCTGNAIRIDYESLFPRAMLEQYEEMDVEISGTDLELPNSLSVGQDLPDGSVELKVSMGGINMNMRVDQINRRVEKQESVTTPAGTYDCFVVYSESRTKMMTTNQVIPTRTWLAEGVGMVKTESYDGKGKLVNSMELTNVGG